MACEKKIVSNFTVKAGLLLLAGCILVPMSLATMFGRSAVPLQTLRLLFSLGSSPSVKMWGGERIGSHRSERNEGPVQCDFSSSRSDVCELKGDVRVLPNATIVLLHPSARRRPWRMKPHARKSDGHALARVTELTLAVASPRPAEHAAPRCTARHAAPAVVFSAGGYAGNMFHDLTDVLVPLFITARRFAGDVHLLVADAQPRWLDRYGPLLRGLSRHRVVDMGMERAGVLCFPRVVVGLEFHKEMSVDAARAAGEYSMADFARLARSSYGLPRHTAIRLHGRRRGVGGGPGRPRLLIISRKATRAFTNAGAVARAAAAAGYEVVVGEPEQGGELAAFAREVNAADVLVGVHGAGLANLVFLPAGAVVVQVVPLGGLDAMAAEDFGAPAGDMGLGYVHYGIAVGESSLARRYPREHRVLRDPAAVRREGWMALRAAYLVGQNVTLDVDRFGAALRRAMALLP
ncbi:hypothetical protein ACP4OV_022409 [Aristida adscensionis]